MKWGRWIVAAFVVSLCTGTVAISVAGAQPFTWQAYIASWEGDALGWGAVGLAALVVWMRRARRAE